MKYGLQERNKMSSIEKVDIFVYTITLGISSRDVCERFQCSSEIINRAFHEIMEAICGWKNGFVGLACDLTKSRDLNFRYIPT